MNNSSKNFKTNSLKNKIVFTISIWYLVFSTSLYNITILIGFENTEVIINYLLDNTVFFESLCFQTVYILDALSAKLGFSIYIPSIINIFSVISKFFDNDNTECSNEKASNSSSWPFSGGNNTKSHGETDMNKCESLAIRRNKKKRNYIMNCAIHEGESPSP